MVVGSIANKMAGATDRLHALENAFNELADTDAPVGGCDDIMLQPASGRLAVNVSLDPMESSSNFSLVSRLIASVTPLDEVGVRARVLLTHYKDLKGLIRAATRDIQQNEVLTDMERSILRTVRDVSTSFLRECSARNPQITSFSDLHSYLKVSLATEQAEVTRLIMLDIRNYVIADELHGLGKLNQAQSFPKQVVARAVAHNAAAVIIVHSHPSGEPEPTRDDVKLTRRLAFVLEELGVRLFDYVVVGQRVVVSLGRLGILDQEGGSGERR